MSILTIYNIAAASGDALWRKVTPSIRSISCEIREDKVFFQYVYDKAPSPEEDELRYLFEGYFLANIGGSADYNFEILVMAQPLVFKALPIKIYGRFEGMDLA